MMIRGLVTLLMGRLARSDRPAERLVQREQLDAAMALMQERRARLLKLTLENAREGRKDD